jgi:hypothetical protein|tara:strand:+ start:151 stop:693 length:543 start_codon:yes stop_codon:yes gene_type:complete
VSADEITQLRARVRQLEDREEIRGLVSRYGRVVDDREWDVLADLFAPDAVFDSVGGRAVGMAAIAEYYKAGTQDLVASYHYAHSHEISFDDADRPSGLVCAHAELAFEDDTVWTALRYHDQYRRVDGRWRFSERVTRLLYVLKLADLPTGFADEMRVRWPGREPVRATLGADVAPEAAAD